MKLKLASLKLVCALPLLALALLAAPAQAQLTLNFTPANQFGNPGDTLHFSGMFTNPTADTIYLNGLQSDFSGPAMSDTSPFSTSPTQLDPMGTIGTDGTPTDSYTGGVFDLTLNPDAAPGTYYGTFAVLGGATDTSSDDVTLDPNAPDNPKHFEQFSVTVLPSAQPIPELSSTVSLGLLLTLGGLVVVARRRRAYTSA